MKKLIAAVTIAGTALTAGAGVAAAEPGADGTGRPGAGSQPDGARADTERADTERSGRRGQVLAAALQVAADTIGVSTDELRQAVQGGQTVAQVAESKGVDPQQVTAAIVAAATGKIDEAVANDRIDAARAAMLKEKLPQAVDRLVNATRKPPGEGGSDQRAGKAGRHERRQRAAGAALDTAAGALDITSDELASKLKSGKSIADVAQEAGVELPKVTGALVDAAKRKIAEAVESGRLPADKAEKLEAKLAERIDRLVHRTFGRRGSGEDASQRSAL